MNKKLRQFFEIIGLLIIYHLVKLGVGYGYVKLSVFTASIVLSLYNWNDFCNSPVVQSYENKILVMVMFSAGLSVITSWLSLPCLINQPVHSAIRVPTSFTTDGQV